MAIKKIVIVGATSLIAEHCARQWSQTQNIQFVLIVRHIEKARKISADLKVRNPNTLIDIRKTNFTDPKNIQSIVNEILIDGAIDLVLIAHGELSQQKQCQNDLKSLYETLQINAVSLALFSEAFANKFMTQNRGTLVILGSVAGDRGRQSNYIYGASKGFIERYTEGLQHRFANTPVRVILVKPGPTDTPMTKHLKQEGKNLASPAEVAHCIIRGIQKGKPKIYAPTKWRFLMYIIRFLPNFIFYRLKI